MADSFVWLLWSYRRVYAEYLLVVMVVVVATPADCNNLRSCRATADKTWDSCSTCRRQLPWLAVGSVFCCLSSHYPPVVEVQVVLLLLLVPTSLHVVAESRCESETDQSDGANGSFVCSGRPRLDPSLLH